MRKIKGIIKHFFSLMFFVIIILILGSLGAGFIIILTRLGAELFGTIGLILFGIFSMTSVVYIASEIVFKIQE